MPAAFRKPVFFNPAKPRAKRMVDMAVKATQRGSSEGTKLATTCWTAVIKCAEMSGAISQRAAALLNANVQSNNPSAFVPDGSDVIESQAAWDAIAPGCFVALLGPSYHSNPMSQDDEGRVLSHAMVSLGNGQMAGSNNGVIGFAGNWSLVELDERHTWQNGFLVYEGRAYRVLVRDIESQDKPSCIIM